MIDLIYNSVKTKKNMGARPILRSIEELIEDKVVDILLNKDEEDSYTFTDKDFLTEWWQWG